MANPCPSGQVLDKATKECRPPLKRGRKLGRFSATTKAPAKTTAPKNAKKPCPDGQVLDKRTKECRPPLKRGRTAKNSPNNKSPNKSPKGPKGTAKVQDNETLDKYGFAIPVYKPKVYTEKTYRQTTLAFGKRNP
jgi:hypothetical protein